MSAPLENLLRDARIDLVLARIEKDPTIINEVIDYLDSDIRSIRFNSIYVLGELGEKCNEEAVNNLISCCGDEDWSICREAARSLGKIGFNAKQAVTELSKLLKSKEESIRKESANALGKIKNPTTESLNSLIEALDDKNEEVRTEVANALGEIGPEAYNAISRLMKSIKDINWAVRSASAQAISQIGKGSAKAIPSLVSALEDKDWRVRYRIVNTLAEIGEESIPSILEIINHENPIVRKEAIEVLGEIKKADPKVLENLYLLLKDTKETVRGKAADALRSIGKEAIPSLIKSYDENLKIPMIWILYWIIPFLSVPLWLSFGAIFIFIIALLIPLIATPIIFINHIKANIRRKILIISSIGGIGEEAKEAIPFIIEKIKRGKKFIRVEAARALGNVGIGSEDAKIALQDALRDKSHIVRREAALSLGKMGIYAEDAIPSLINALKDKNPDVRWRITETLGKIGVDTQEVISSLKGLIHDECDYVCESAINALDSLTED